MDKHPPAFVFVLCGAASHVDTLNFAIRALQKFSQHDILIVTDTTRNERKLDYPKVIDIKTPDELDHHQASIFLKTGLHRFLPAGRRYCYLDTDVIALNDSVNHIFSQMQGPITFAADHCRMRQFSPYAVHCGCLNHHRQQSEALNALLERYSSAQRKVLPHQQAKAEALQQKLELLKRNRLRLLQLAARYILSPAMVQFDQDTYYLKKERCWVDAEGEPIRYEYDADTIHRVETHSKWRWSLFKRRWISPEGHDLSPPQCDHLRQAIYQTFNIRINQRNWQHWNGGVFLFDDSSHAFMDNWHQKTLTIFQRQDWQTRDQGTLIATAWELGLQQHPTLPQHFNFIADYANPQLIVSADGQYLTADAFRTRCQPSFIHIFHHFNTPGWQVWDWVMQVLNR